MSRNPSHYLKIHRRRTGLAQTDVANLIGDRTPSRVSRYERGQRLPNLETALVLEVVFGVPVSHLFAGTYAEIERRVADIAKELAKRSSSKKTALAVLRQRSIKTLMQR